MKFSYQWLQQLVHGLHVEPKELLRLITMKTAECEGLEIAGEPLATALPVRVLSVEPIAGSTHNVKAEIELPVSGERKTVVCGAPNCRAGMYAAYLPIGRKVIAGVESDGMLASGQELGINDNHEGIVELSGPAIEWTPDAVIEVDNKSLTHRPDLWGHYGMAREVAAITGGRLKDPVDPARIPTGPAPVRIAIHDFALCPRYSALMFENVTVQPSPLWLQFRLEAIGLNPINNIVDVTNFIMAELAQPMHAFDADKLHGDTIHVRNARPNETVLALNKERYTLDESNLVIADSHATVAIAGVIGGDESAISAATTRILFESANFNPASVRKTAAKLKNRTDASMRFEKSQDPETTVRALARAAALLELVSPGIRIVGGLADSYQPLPEVRPIDLPLDWLDRKLGVALPAERVRAILESLEFGVQQPSPRHLIVSVPSWRATKDISIKDDLVEEIGRMVGYGEITPTAPLVAARVPASNPERDYHHSLRDLVAAQGYTETYNYSFLSEEAVREFGWSPGDHVHVLNPIASDQSIMRKSLLPGILANIRENRKHFDAFRLYEIGVEIHKRAPEALPTEIPHLVAAQFSKDDGAAALAELKRLAECVVKGATVRPTTPRPFEHPARAAEILAPNGRPIGRLFEFHPDFVEAGRGAILDLDLAATHELARAAGNIKFQPIRRFPTSDFDLSVVTGLRTLIGDIQSKLTQYGAADLVAIEFLRQYAGPPLADGQKSVSFRMTLGAPDRTLSSEELTAIRTRIIDGMRAQGFDLRI